MQVLSLGAASSPAASFLFPAQCALNTYHQSASVAAEPVLDHDLDLAVAEEPGASEGPPTGGLRGHHACALRPLRVSWTALLSVFRAVRRRAREKMNMIMKYCAT